jgi:hypothetical protein
MRRIAVICWSGLLVAGACGCAQGPLLDNPLRLTPARACMVENPVYIPLGPQSYGKVYEKVLDILDDYFEISYTNRQDGRIETFPRIAPGYEQFWKKGDPDFYQRLYATLQTLRHRCVVLIQPAEDGGYFVQVTVYKELEDLPRPSRSTAGAATFFTPNDVERQFTVIDPTVFESSWIPLGRDPEFEQQILEQIKKCV